MSCAETLPLQVEGSQRDAGDDVDDDEQYPAGSDASRPRPTQQGDAGAGVTRADGGARTGRTRGEDPSTKSIADEPSPWNDEGAPGSERDARASNASGAGYAPSDAAGQARTQPQEAPAGSCAIPGDAQAEDVSSPTTVVGTGTPASCTSSAFVEAVARGGVITFDCGPAPVTITLQETAKVFNRSRKVVIDGGNKVTLSGGGRVRILYQNTCDQRQAFSTDHCDNQDHPLLTVQNITFEGGNAVGLGEGGGAIYAQGGRLKVFNARFYNNVCDQNGDDIGGGAIRAFQQYSGLPLYIVNSAFAGNSGSSGGAISSIGVSYTLINSTFRDNRATGGSQGGGNGGAIANDGTDYHLNICGSLIENNSANEDGGAITFVSNDRTGTLNIRDATLQNNRTGRAETYPGIFSIARGEPSITNSVVR